MPRFLTAIAALSGFFAVIADSLARHALGAHAADLAMTGARYGLVHAAVLLALAALLPRVGEGAARRWALAASWCFVVAIVLFCGVLYLQAAGILLFLLPLVPVGGTLFIIGWGALAVSAFWRRPPL